jgi:hypothetical protein
MSHLLRTTRGHHILPFEGIWFVFDVTVYFVLFCGYAVSVEQRVSVMAACHVTVT